MDKNDTKAEICELTEGSGANCVFAIGLNAGQEAAMAAVRPGEALVLVDVVPLDLNAHFSNFEMHVHEERILGRFYGSTVTRGDVPHVLDLYRAGKFKLDKMILKRSTLEHNNKFYTDWIEDDIRRGVILFDRG